MPYNTIACVGATIGLFVISCLSLMLRLYTRLFLLRNFAVDDYLATIATVTNSPLAISYFLGVLRYGLGSYRLIKDSQSGLLVIFIGELFYFITTYLAKLSFACTLFRIATKKHHTYILYTLVSTGLVITSVSWFWVLFSCKPVQYFWEQVAVPVTGGSCKSDRSMGVVMAVHASWVLLADLTLGLVLPLLILWSSQMHRRMKLSVCLLLASGLVASVATIIRLNYLPNSRSATPLMDHHPLAFWSVIEAAISIICTAAIAMKPLIAHLGIFHGSRSGGHASDFSYPTYYGTGWWEGGRGQGVSRSARAQPSVGKDNQYLEAFSDRWLMMEPLDSVTQQASHRVVCQGDGMAWRENRGILVQTEIHMHTDV